MYTYGVPIMRIGHSQKAYTRVSGSRTSSWMVWKLVRSQVIGTQRHEMLIASTDAVPGCLTVWASWPPGQPRGGGDNPPQIPNSSRYRFRTVARPKTCTVMCNMGSNEYRPTACSAHRDDPIYQICRILDTMRSTSQSQTCTCSCQH